MLARLTQTPWAGVEQRVISLTAGGPVRQQLQDKGVWVQDVGLRMPEPMPLFRLARHIRNWKPDVVQGWMYHGDLASTLALALSGRRKKTVSAWGADVRSGLAGTGFGDRQFPCRARKSSGPGLSAPALGGGP
jgi:hypothetical protein